MSNHLRLSSSTLTTLRHLNGAVRRFGRLPSSFLPTAFEPVSLSVPAIGIRDGCIAIEGAGLEPMTVWIFREQREPCGHPSDHGDIEDDVVRVGGASRRRGCVFDELESAALHVLAPQVALAFEGAQVVIHAVRRPDAHVRADLAERGRVAAALDRGSDEIEGLLLPLGQALHDDRPTVLNACPQVKLSAYYLLRDRVWQRRPSISDAGCAELRFRCSRSHLRSAPV